MSYEHDEATQNQLSGLAINNMDVEVFKRMIQKYHNATDPLSVDVWLRERREAAHAIIDRLDALLKREAKYNLSAAVAIVKQAYPALEIEVDRAEVKREPELQPAPGSIAERLLATESPQALERLLEELSWGLRKRKISDAFGN
jgi:thioredoxin-like negative regulator of GroEL